MVTHTPQARPTRSTTACQGVPWHQVQIHDSGYWGMRRRVNSRVTLDIEYEQCLKTGRIDAFRLNWKEGMPNKPHQFWDSDVAKWVEAAAYDLACHPNPELEKKLEHVVNLIVSSQQPDGYINSFYCTLMPEKRLTNLMYMHELYCAGHLMEAAVAHYQATGRRHFLEAMCRYADLIDSIFGPESEGKMPGYDGHQEIELALVKLYQATGEKRYLKLAEFFVLQRGQEPNFFVEESRRRENLTPTPASLINQQAHLPILKQNTAEGHAVRAGYFFAGAADVASATGDKRLFKQLRKLWENITRKRMYLTGGIGSTAVHEKFTIDYDLPNESAYAETCATISLLFFAHRMLMAQPLAEYADVIERALYNGITSGVNLKGDRFFYANPLAASPALNHGLKGSISPVRQPWFSTSCCPPNLARLLASLGQYIYAASRETLYVHQYISSDTHLELAGQSVKLTQTTNYPWDETVTLKIHSDAARPWTLAVRWPGWCRQVQVRINGKLDRQARADSTGYIRLTRQWQAGDTVELVLAMPVERQYAHPACRMNQGKVALTRGPVVYCVEAIDAKADPFQLTLPPTAKLSAVYEPKLLGGCVAIDVHNAIRVEADKWTGDLYSTRRPSYTKTSFRAIPYALWNNRKPGNMTVWINEV